MTLSCCWLVSRAALSACRYDHCPARLVPAAKDTSRSRKALRCASHLSFSGPRSSLCCFPTFSHHRCHSATFCCFADGADGLRRRPEAGGVAQAQIMTHFVQADSGRPGLGSLETARPLSRGIGMQRGGHFWSRRSIRGHWSRRAHRPSRCAACPPDRGDVHKPMGFGLNEKKVKKFWLFA